MSKAIVMLVMVGLLHCSSNVVFVIKVGISPISLSFQNPNKLVGNFDIHNFHLTIPIAKCRLVSEGLKN